MSQQSNESPFRHPTRFDVWRRQRFCALMRWFGHPHYVMRAQGAEFLVGETDLIDRSLAYYGIWEGEQLDHLARVCRARPADLFLDVGANIGFYSIMMLQKGLARDAVAFEPDPGNYARLLANLHLNGLIGKVTTLPLAAGREGGDIMLAQAAAENRGESWVMHPDKPPEEAGVVATHRVRQVRIDDEVTAKGKSIVVKMDVEGAEFHALAGMRRTLMNNFCYLQVELYSDRFEELRSLFHELGYRYLRSETIDHYFTNMTDAT